VCKSASCEIKIQFLDIFFLAPAAIALRAVVFYPKMAAGLSCARFEIGRVVTFLVAGIP
jgi:hypothetical protein